MQPYFFPYIGYFQLMNCVDEFVVYDNIQFTKKGWVNRNRILNNGKDCFLSLPLKHGSDYLDINERNLADTWLTDKKKILNKLSASYKNASFFHEAFPVIKACLDHEDRNLFNFIFYSLKTIKQYLDITTPFIVSSRVSANHQLKGKERVMSICKALNAGTYVNNIGGSHLYDDDYFRANNTKLLFFESVVTEYKQSGQLFIPKLSIIDVMMFNSKSDIKTMLDQPVLQ